MGEKIKQHAPTIIVVAAVIALIGLLAYNANKPTTGRAEIKVAETAKKQEAQQEQAVKKKLEASKDYSYTAIEGDSFTVLARKSVQAYATANNVTLSKAQVIAAETSLAQQANSPAINVGESVVIKNMNLQAAVEAAKSLSAADLAAWETYVPYVVF